MAVLNFQARKFNLIIADKKYSLQLSMSSGAILNSVAVWM